MEDLKKLYDLCRESNLWPGGSKPNIKLLLLWILICVCVCVCVCERERERERVIAFIVEKSDKKEKGTQTHLKKYLLKFMILWLFSKIN